MSRRALRRHHRQRLWRRRGRYYPHWQQRRKRIVIDTPKPCSCPSCSRNFERRHDGKVTRQEELAALVQQEQEAELYDDTVDYELPTMEECRNATNEGFNAWLASLPLDDWGDGAFDDWVAVRWDEEKQELVEDDDQT